MSQEHDQGQKGFIEELRQRHDVQITQAPQIKAAKKEEARRQREAERIIDTSWEIEKKAKQEQARKYLDESGIYGLVQQVAELDVSHKYKMGVTKIKPDSYPSKVEFEFRWLVKKDGLFGLGGRNDGEGVTIAVNALGEIEFEAGEEGSSVLGLTEWRENPDLLSSALKRAYENPRSIVREFIRPHQRNPFYIPK